MAHKNRLRKRKRLDSPRDLISGLPRDVIDAIMERLPLRDAAKMSVLSRKWLEIWTSIQTLSFDTHSFTTFAQSLHGYYDSSFPFSIFVSKILFHHEGSLQRFHLDIPALSSPPDINQWICYLSRKGVSEIDIEYTHTVPLKFGSHIFFCSNLKKLRLPYLNISPRNFRGFPKLTCLELDKPTFSEESLKCLIRNCPLLTRFSITNFDCAEHIVINAPNLSLLWVDGTFKSLDVRNAANLVAASFGLQAWVELCHQARLDALLETLASSCNLQNLCFRGYFCKVLYKNSLMQTPFQKLRNLELLLIHLNDVDDFSSIIRTIQSCPVIERLFISVDSSQDFESEELHYNPEIILANLRYTDVRIYRGSSTELNLIEFVLKSSPILNKLLVSTLGNIMHILQPKAVTRLLNCYRASGTVEIVLPSPEASSTGDYITDNIYNAGDWM